MMEPRLRSQIWCADKRSASYHHPIETKTHVINYRRKHHAAVQTSKRKRLDHPIGGVPIDFTTFPPLHHKPDQTQKKRETLPSKYAETITARCNLSRFLARPSMYPASKILCSVPVFHAASCDTAPCMERLIV